MSARNLVIVGIGGVGRALGVFVEEAHEARAKWNLLGYVDDEAGSEGRVVGGKRVLGPIHRLIDFAPVDVLVAVGNPLTRRAVVRRLSELDGLEFPVFLHPDAYVPSGVVAGEGTIVYPGARVDPDTRIGSFVLLNMNSTVGHDSTIDDFVTLAPGVSIGGSVNVEEAVDIGIGASCKQGLRLGAESRVGAGAAVISDVGSGETVVGVPAKPVDIRR
jgi:sugar O-acyltransferase (sialic acid O-acetyltransferase NeuD family)